MHFRQKCLTKHRSNLQTHILLASSEHTNTHCIHKHNLCTDCVYFTHVMQDIIMAEIVIFFPLIIQVTKAWWTHTHTQWHCIGLHFFNTFLESIEGAGFVCEYIWRWCLIAEAIQNVSLTFQSTDGIHGCHVLAFAMLGIIEGAYQAMTNICCCWWVLGLLAFQPITSQLYAALVEKLKEYTAEMLCSLPTHAHKLNLFYFTNRYKQ